MKHDRMIPTKSRIADHKAECPQCGLAWEGRDAKRLANHHTSETGHRTLLYVIHAIDVNMEG